MDIYVDGSYCPYTKKSGIGINISNSGNSHGLFSYSEKTKGWCSLKCELLAIERAIHILKTFDYNVKNIYTDCLAIVNCFTRNHFIKGFEPFCERLYKLIRSMKLKLIWVKREKNRVADNLAREARKS